MALQMGLGVLTCWLERREREAIACLVEENRLLRRQLVNQRLRLTDDDRRRPAAWAYRVGRSTLREIATIATPDTLLRWQRQLIARKWTHVRQAPNLEKDAAAAGGSMTCPFESMANAWHLLPSLTKAIPLTYRRSGRHAT